MLSLHGLGAAGAGAAGYYAALARDDYYTRGGEPPGDWLGRGAASLGLSGTVDAAALRHVLHGFDGTGATARVQGAGADHHAGWDLTFSAPKSVSVLWATTDDPAVRAAIRDAQRAAVTATLAFAERHCAFTRRGHDGAGPDRRAFSHVDSPARLIQALTQPPLPLHRLEG